MALKIKKASDTIECVSIKALLYGEPGIGKTTLSLTSPNPLLIDCDLGIRRVSPQFRKDYVEANKWEDIADLVNNPVEIANYDTLVIDTVGKLLELMGTKIIADNFKLGSKTGGLTLQGYGTLLAEFRAFNAKLTRMGKNVIYLAHDSEFKDGDKTKLRPDITGKSMGTVLREMDLVGYMQSRNNERTISFTPSDTYYGKNTCGLSNVISIGDMNKEAIKPMTDIFNHFKKMIDSQSEIMAKYAVLMDTADKHIEGVTDVKTATQVSETLKSVEEIWDSKTVIRIKFQEKLNELGIKWNKEKSVFEKEGKNVGKD